MFTRKTKETAIGSTLTVSRPVPYYPNGPDGSPQYLRSPSQYYEVSPGLSPAFEHTPFQRTFAEAEMEEGYKKKPSVTEMTAQLYLSGPKLGAVVTVLCTVAFLVMLGGGIVATVCRWTVSFPRSSSSRMYLLFRSPFANWFTSLCMIRLYRQSLPSSTLCRTLDGMGLHICSQSRWYDFSSSVHKSLANANTISSCAVQPLSGKIYICFNTKVRLHISASFLLLALSAERP